MKRKVLFHSEPQITTLSAARSWASHACLATPDGAQDENGPMEIARADSKSSRAKHQGRLFSTLDEATVSGVTVIVKASTPPAHR